MEADVQTPMERVERLYADLVLHYGEGDQREIRAAAKILLVALAKFREHGGPQWESLLDEYVNALKQDPARFERMLESNRATASDQLLA
ncbi:hypothetical protein F2Q65_12640 [Thiohalocapsa marina]|uniref:Uncharacterized protein n=1 Tax=Thiohalocapsa marina TaxID=424902 RepID=A0A5M8FHU2_9GAMM|nr:hypothetical protein [Thiohalocapsa marina]KAA6184307.1 hypothetical protein F2Q65_12640 [Thiohalocapsa marina]